VPRSQVVLYCEAGGTVPLLDWLASLPDKVREKCLLRIQRLADLGHELRRPEADYLRDGIHELRIGFRGQNYRILYFFHTTTAVLSHGLVKEGRLPAMAIERARERKRKLEENPPVHTYKREF
jgi:hypothetical protein